MMCVPWARSLIFLQKIYDLADVYHCDNIDSIIRYREKNGSFSSVEEIKQVEGIKEGVYNRIKDHIKVK